MTVLPDLPLKGLPGSPRLLGCTNGEGVAWREYRRGLTPRYWLAWRDVALCYAMALGAFAAHVALDAALGSAIGLLTAPVFALWIGYWLHALWLSGHEAGHYHLARDRRLNDRLADLLVWPLFANTTARYRSNHWNHHRHLGDPQDSEISYHNCLSPWFLFKAATGIYLIGFFARNLAGRAGGPQPGRRGVSPGVGQVVLPMLAVTVLLHLAFVVPPLWYGYTGAACAWLAGILLVVPFLGSVRQVLEHRAADARCDSDFGTLEHGPVNRMFSGGIPTQYFGAAGFDRHLLHHWDPDISYTRFDDMEAFLRDSSLADRVEECRTSYLGTLRQLCATALRP